MKSVIKEETPVYMSRALLTFMNEKLSSLNNELQLEFILFALEKINVKKKKKKKKKKNFSYIFLFSLLFLSSVFFPFFIFSVARNFI